MRALLLVLAAGPLLCACGGNAADARPNLVLLISDDQDYEHLGFLGHPLVQTPTLDRLAEEGTVFPVAHVAASRCRPSLASILSAKWPHQHGIFFNRGEKTLDPALALPRLLRDAGYATYLGGKFWEGDPEAMGFEASTPDNEFVREGQEECFAFIRENAGKRPLLLWWSPKIPHYPHDPPKRYLDAIDPAAIPEPPWFDRPEWAGIDRVDWRAKEHAILATVGWLDDAIGELRAELESAGILENTLFCFLTDNGSSAGAVSKGSPFEKGMRTPLVFSWPGNVPSGEERTELVSALDVMPTLLEYAGVPVPAGLAGRGLRPLIEGRSSEAARDVLYGAAYPREAVRDAARPERNVYALYARTPDSKYVLYLEKLDVERNAQFRIKHDAAPHLLRTRGDEDLFDVVDDPYELDDLAEDPEHRARMDELRAGVLAWWAETGGKPLRVP